MKATKKKRILWIDDEYQSLPWLLSQLELLVGKTNVVTTQTEQEVETILSKERTPFSCVLMDIMFPRDRDELSDGLVRTRRWYIDTGKNKKRRISGATSRHTSHSAYCTWH